MKMFNKTYNKSFSIYKEYKTISLAFFNKKKNEILNIMYTPGYLLAYRYTVKSMQILCVNIAVTYSSLPQMLGRL